MDDNSLSRRFARYACLRTTAFERQRLHHISCKATVLDREIVRRVGEALSPVSLKAALEAIQGHHAQGESERRARRHQLQDVKDSIDELKGELRRLGPDRQVYRNELEADVEALILRRSDLERQVKRENAARPVLTPADADELLALTANFDELWNAATTTNADRKQLLRIVIARVILRAPADGAVDERLEAIIEWIGGCRETCQILRPKGIARLAVAMRRQGRSTKEITATFAAAGFTTCRGRAFSRKTLQHRLWDEGFNTKDDRIAALRLIWAMLVERRSRREILERLRTEGPRPKEGEWTGARLTNAITSLKQNCWAPHIAPLPAYARVLRKLPPEAIEIIRQGRSERPPRAFKEIAAQLNALGYRTPRDRAFTMLGLYQLFDHLKAAGEINDIVSADRDGRGSTAEVRPTEDPNTTRASPSRKSAEDPA